MTISFDSDTRPKRDGESLVEYYLEFRGGEIEKNTEKVFKTSWRSLQGFLEGKDYSLGDMKKDEALDWCEYLQTRDIKESYAETLVGNMKQMMDELKQTPEVEGANPFKKALKTDPFSYDDSTNKLEVGINALRAAIYNIGHPVQLLIVVILLKTGLRCSELYNLDERDINIDRPISEILDAPRPEIRKKPNTIYVDSSISEGDEVNGEVRNYGNKPDSYREVPLDEETVDILEWYLTMAPSSKSEANPIVRVFGNGGHDAKTGDRLGSSGIYIYVKDWAKKHQWDVEDGVTPHWFRHWFTTQLRARIDHGEVPIGSPKGYVEGLRGDTSDSTIETYTQDWDVDDGAKDYAEVYRDNIPELFVDMYEDGEMTCPSCGRTSPAVVFSTVESVDAEGRLCNSCTREEYVSI